MSRKFLELFRSVAEFIWRYRYCKILLSVSGLLTRGGNQKTKCYRVASKKGRSILWRVRGDSCDQTANPWLWCLPPLQAKAAFRWIKRALAFRESSLSRSSCLVASSNNLCEVSDSYYRQSELFSLHLWCYLENGLVPPPKPFSGERWTFHREGLWDTKWSFLEKHGLMDRKKALPHPCDDRPGTETIMNFWREMETARGGLKTAQGHPKSPQALPNYVLLQRA